MDLVLSENDCVQILKETIGTACDFVSCHVSPLGESPAGFLGSHFRLKINARKHGKSLKRELFMKTLPKSIEAHMEYVAQMGVFRKEAQIYEELLPELSELCTKQFSPRCYLVREEFIVLEDVSLCGFKTVTGRNCLDFPKLTSLMKTVGKFHASSLILEEKRSLPGKPYRLNKHFGHMLFESTFNFTSGHPRNSWIYTTSTALKKLLALLPEYKDVDLDQKLDELVLSMEGYLQPSKRFRNVVNHADLWSNNIMFDERNYCLLVDYQLARYVPPALDLLTCLYLTSDPTKNHIPDLLLLYYQSLSKELLHNGLDPTALLSLSEFQQMCRHYEPAALLEAAMFATIIFLNEEISKDMLTNTEEFKRFMYTDRAKLVQRAFNEDPVYRERCGMVLQRLAKYLKGSCDSKDSINDSCLVSSAFLSSQ